MSMPRERRLRKTADFVTARREGKSWSDRRLVLIAKRRRSHATRFGFSVSKRLGNAVARNSIRRRLKSAASEADVKDGWDLVFIARQGARNADFWQLRRSLNRLMDRAGVAAPTDNRSKRSQTESKRGKSD